MPNIQGHATAVSVAEVLEGLERGVAAVKAFLRRLSEECQPPRCDPVIRMTAEHERVIRLTCANDRDLLENGIKAPTEQQKIQALWWRICRQR